MALTLQERLQVIAVDLRRELVADPEGAVQAIDKALRLAAQAGRDVTMAAAKSAVDLEFKPPEV